MLKLKLQYFGHLMWRADSLEKTDAGKDWGQKGTAEDEMVGWHHWLSGHEFEQALGDGEGQGSLAYVGSQRVGQDLATEQQMVYPRILNRVLCALQWNLIVHPSYIMIVWILILTPSPRVSCFPVDKEDVSGIEALMLPCSRLHSSKDDRCVGWRQQQPWVLVQRGAELWKPSRRRGACEDDPRAPTRLWSTPSHLGTWYWLTSPKNPQGSNFMSKCYLPALSPPTWPSWSVCRSPPPHTRSSLGSLELPFHFSQKCQLCPILCDHMDCSPPGSSVHGALQVRILEWVAMPSSRGSCWPRDWMPISCIASRIFTICINREAHHEQIQCVNL